MIFDSDGKLKPGCEGDALKALYKYAQSNPGKVTKMKIQNHLDNLLDDLETLKPESLSEIVRFVCTHSEFSTIMLMVRNSTRSAKCLLKQCQALADLGTMYDVQLAGLLVIVAKIDTEMYNGLVSRASNGVGEYHWSRGIATTYLLHKEVKSETIRISA